MGNWKSDYAEALLPEGKFIGTIMTCKSDSFESGTEFANLMIRIDEFLDDYKAGPEVMDPLNQNVFGRLWYPSGEDDEKDLGKQKQLRRFLEAIERALPEGDELDDEGCSSPFEVFLKNMDLYAGKAIKANVVQENKEDDDDFDPEFPTKAIANLWNTKRA